MTIPREIALSPNLSGDAKILYGHILSLSYRDGYCFATNAWFAKAFGKHERTVKRWIAELVDAELLRVVDGNSKKRQLFPAINEKGDPTPTPNRDRNGPVQRRTSDKSVQPNRDTSVPVNQDRIGPVTGTDLSIQPGQICPPTTSLREGGLQKEDAGAHERAPDAPSAADGIRSPFAEGMAIVEHVIHEFGSAFEGTVAVVPKSPTTGLIQSLAMRCADLRREGIEPDAEYWPRLFAHLAQSDFLAGRRMQRSGQPFRLRLDWLLREEEFAKARSHAYCDAGVCPHVHVSTGRGVPA
jgi:hypothetical protein